MKKKALITVPISIILVAMIVASFVLINMKPSTGNVKKGQRLAEYTKSAVVRIIDYAVVTWQYSGTDSRVSDVLNQVGNQTSISSSGSGAIISSDGYIVTNGHVVEFSHQMSDKDLVNTAFEQFVTQVAKAYNWDVTQTYNYILPDMGYTMGQKGTKVYLPAVKEPLDADVKIYSAPIGQGKDVAVLKIAGENYPTISLGDSNDIENQENIWAIGYPAAADSDVLSSDSLLESTMNGGQISSTSKTTDTGSPVIQINAATTHGNSGGPVINDKGQIIGLLTFRGDTVNGQEVQGFNFAVPVNTVKEFVNQAGARNTKSSTKTLFIEALNLYWGGYYKEALAKFEAVQRIYPNQADIKKYISDSEQKLDSGKTLWSEYKTTFFIVDGIAALIVIGLLLFTFVFGNKPKKMPVVSSGGSRIVAMSFCEPRSCIGRLSS